MVVMQYLQNCHTIPEGEKAITFLNGGAVGVHNVVIARKRRDQHDQRAFGEMEIGHKSVEHLELIAGVDEDVRKALAGLDPAVLRRNALKRAAGGGADGDDPSAVFLGFVDEPCGLLGDLVVLAVHLVLCHVLDLDGTEGAETDVKGDIGDPHALLTYALHKLVGEVQSRGGSGGGAELMAVDRLIPLLVAELLGDVGRQRHLTDLVESGEEVLVAVEVDHAVAVVPDLGDCRAENAVSEGEGSSLTRFFAGLA